MRRQVLIVNILIFHHPEKPEIVNEKKSEKN